MYVVSKSFEDPEVTSHVHKYGGGVSDLAFTPMNMPMTMIDTQIDLINMQMTLINILITLVCKLIMA